MPTVNRQTPLATPPVSGHGRIALFHASIIHLLTRILVTRLLAALLAVAIGALDTSAQSALPSFAGRWQFEITPTGSVRSPSTQGTLTFATRSDTLEMRVEWQPGADGRRSPDRTMIGRVQGDTAVFTDTSEGTVSAESRSAGIQAIVTWILAPREQSLTGTISFEVPGMSLPFEPIPVRAVRVDSAGNTDDDPGGRARVRTS